MSSPRDRVLIRQLGRQPYVPVWQAMQAFTDQRHGNTVDELWLLEHERVFTQGQAGKAEHLLAPGDIPVVQVDRGGQVTYHGPGQITVYTLIDLQRRGLGVRDLVSCLEQALVATLAHWHIEAHPRSDAPGVYLGEEKIASLGLRVRRGCAFHGLALNVAMDLSPFQRINPCGHAGMPVTQMSDRIAGISTAQVAPVLLEQLVSTFGYSERSNAHSLTDGLPQSQ
ncbi:MAG: lipoyl(octanoyl) transferase LipB [Oleiphilaceae bacterium]|nr:lipoyl(octanoyl) transferase LipB [Oleiphilaceae bacterium]